MKKRVASLLLILALCLGLAAPVLADFDSAGDVDLADATQAQVVIEDDEPADVEPEEEALVEDSWSIPYPDVSDSASYAEAVATLYNLGIMQGDNNGNFNPNAKITRAEVAAIMCRLMGEEDAARRVKTSGFDDVPKNHWAVGYIGKAAQLGIINGNGAGSFMPGDYVTYEQMLKMLVCAWGYEAQAQAAGGWPNGYVSAAKQLGIAKGLSFSSTSVAPRKDVAVLVFNALNR